MVPITAKTGPTRAVVAAAWALIPNRDFSSPASPLRTQNRKARAIAPITSVGPLVCGSSVQIEPRISGSV